MLREALTTKEKGPKVIVAQSECMLNRQRRMKPLLRKAMKDGKRVVRERFGVDPDTCTGDHSCIRLSGCPSLSMKPNPDPLRRDPVAAVDNSCVGCGVCGEVAHAAVLCPSFYRAELISNPTRWDRFRARLAARHRLVAAPRGGRCLTEPRRSPRFARMSWPRRARSPLRSSRWAARAAACWRIGSSILPRATGMSSQSTSVPGVAQRTGATIYYVEIFPAALAAASGQDPVLALMPVPGDVDVVIASELMEAARAVQRGLVTPDRTALIASTHRVYSMTEKIAMADGRADARAMLAACRAAAERLIAADMQRLAEEAGSVISAVAVRRAGRVRRAALQRARSSRPRSAAAASAWMPASPPSRMASMRGSPMMLPRRRMRSRRSATASSRKASGVSPIIRMRAMRANSRRSSRLSARSSRRTGDGSLRLLAETARGLALWMSYEDTIRVAELKTRASRLDRVAQEVRLAPDQLLRVREFLHPRLEEIADTVPAWLGRALLARTPLRSLLEHLTRRGRLVETTSRGRLSPAARGGGPAAVATVDAALRRGAGAHRRLARAHR